ncbi:hypothetical protein J3A83DRAFT_1598505 [Scleroderma citrinum]
MISSISTVLSKSLISCHLRYLSHCLTPSPSTSSSALRLPLPIRFFAFSYLSGPSSALSKIELQNRISISNHNHAYVISEFLSHLTPHLKRPCASGCNVSRQQNFNPPTSSPINTYYTFETVTKFHSLDILAFSMLRSSAVSGTAAYLLRVVLRVRINSLNTITMCPVMLQMLLQFNRRCTSLDTGASRCLRGACKLTVLFPRPVFGQHGCPDQSAVRKPSR